MINYHNIKRLESVQQIQHVEFFEHFPKEKSQRIFTFITPIFISIFLQNPLYNHQAINVFK